MSEQQAIEKFLLRINKELKQPAKTQAKKENRSLNQYVVNVIQEDLQKKGVLSK